MFVKIRPSVRKRLKCKVFIYNYFRIWEKSLNWCIKPLSSVRVNTVVDQSQVVLSINEISTSWPDLKMTSLKTSVLTLT